MKGAVRRDRNLGVFRIESEWISLWVWKKDSFSCKPWEGGRKIPPQIKSCERVVSVRKRQGVSDRQLAGCSRPELQREGEAGDVNLQGAHS